MCVFAFPLLSVKLPTRTQAHTPLACQCASLDADSIFFLFYLLEALDYHIMVYILGHLEL